MAGLICLRTPIDAAHHVMNFTYNMIRETRHDDIILVSHKIEYKIWVFSPQRDKTSTLHMCASTYRLGNIIFKRLRATAGQGPNYVGPSCGMLAYVGLIFTHVEPKDPKNGNSKKHCKTQDSLMVGGHLGATLAHRGAMLAYLEGNVGPSRGYVDPSWGYVGPSWAMLAHLRAMLAHLGAMLAHLGAMLAHLEAYVGPS